MNEESSTHDNSTLLQIQVDPHTNVHRSANLTAPENRIEDADLKERIPSEDAPPSFAVAGNHKPPIHPSANIDKWKELNSMYVEEDDNDEYIDSDEISDELFRSVDAFSSDDETESHASEYQ